MIAFVLIHFVSNSLTNCWQRFPRFDIFCIIGLRKIQLLELAYRLAEGTLCGLRNGDKIESDGLSDLKLVDFIVINTIIVIIIIIAILLLFINLSIYFSCFFVYSFFFKIYLSLQGTVKQHNIHQF